MKPTFFKSPSALSLWLEANHDKANELLVGFYRKDSGKGGITYPEALDEALCFGWIDGIRRRHDESSYTVRFTPRAAGSIWSEINKKRVGDLTALGRMHVAGQKVFDGRNKAKSNQYSYDRAHCKLKGAFEKKFRAAKKAWDFYQAQAPWYRRTSCWWVMSAKQEPTRLRRLSQLIEDSGHGLRIKPLRGTNSESE